MTSSYFSDPEDHLDPRLFSGEQMKGAIRQALLEMVMTTLDQHFTMPQGWARSWVAGSGVSYQWSAARSPGDLDVLVGVDYVAFRQANPLLRGLSDQEISNQINDVFRAHLMPQTKNWEGYEVTFFVNKSSWDIRAIKPYAAYSLDEADWTVPPSRDGHSQVPREWEEEALQLAAMAQSAIQWYSMAYTDVQGAPNDPARVSAERYLQAALTQASALFDRVHEGRKVAFGPEGQGYDDRNNYLWQAGKRDGWMDPIRELRDYAKLAKESLDRETYGVELPSTDTLIRRAATAYANYPNA